MNQNQISDPPPAKTDSKMPAGWQNHFQARPLRRHMAAWLVVGIALGWLIVPAYQWATISGFLISGMFCCAVLGIMTYPVTDHSFWVLGGAFGGLLICLLAALTIDAGPLDDKLPELGLISGALLGATSLVWLLPFRLILKFRPGVVAARD